MNHMFTWKMVVSSPNIHQKMVVWSSMRFLGHPHISVNSQNILPTPKSPEWRMLFTELPLHVSIHSGQIIIFHQPILISSGIAGVPFPFQKSYLWGAQKTPVRSQWFDQMICYYIVNYQKIEPHPIQPDFSIPSFPNRFVGEGSDNSNDSLIFFVDSTELKTLMHPTWHWLRTEDILLKFCRGESLGSTWIEGKGFSWCFI